MLDSTAIVYCCCGCAEHDGCDHAVHVGVDHACVWNLLQILCSFGVDTLEALSGTCTLYVSSPASSRSATHPTPSLHAPYLSTDLITDNLAIADSREPIKQAPAHFILATYAAMLLLEHMVTLPMSEATYLSLFGHCTPLWMSSVPLTSPSFTAAKTSSHLSL